MRIDIWPLLGTLLLNVAIGSGCGKPADSGPKAAATNAAKQADRSRDVDESIRVSEAEAQQFAEKFSAAIHEGNVAVAAGMIDWDEMARRSAEGTDIGDAALRFAGGVKGTWPDHLVKEIAAAVEQGAGYELLRIHLGRGGRRVMFRLARGEAINYHDLVLYRAPSGEVKIADIYSAVTGELMSQTMQRSLLPIVAHENRSFVERLTGQQADLVKHISIVEEIGKHSEEGRFQEVLAAYDRLPPSLQRDKSMLIIRIGAAKNVSNAEYAAAIGDLIKDHPDDPCAGLFKIDAAGQSGDFDGALSGIDQLDESIGGDPYLDLLRSNLHVKKKDYAKARQLLTKLEAWNPLLIDTQWVYVAISLAEKDYDETVRRLNKVTEEFGVEFEDLTAIPEYAEFVKSPQYEAWMKSRAAAR